MKDCVVVIPVYKNSFTDVEVISLKRIVNILNEYDIVIIIPEGLDISAFNIYLTAEINIIKFNRNYFNGFDGYNTLMLSETFYQTFIKYKYVLICQTDVFVLSNKLDYFIDLNMDYIGAPIVSCHPWKNELKSINGGFSLRNVARTLSFLEKHREQADAWKYAEDQFFQCVIQEDDDYIIADVKTALLFAFDRFDQLSFRLNNKKYPMAVHAWFKGDLEWQQKHLTSMLPKDFIWPHHMTFEEKRKPLEKFIINNKYIALYGAGESGRRYREFIKYYHKDVDCYIVSDGQPKLENLDGKPVFFLSEIANTNLGIIITIDSMYRKMPDFEEILKRKGFMNVYNPDAETSFSVTEKLLQIRYKNQKN